MIYRPSVLLKRFYKIGSICLSVCLSVCRFIRLSVYETFLSGSTQWVLLIFYNEGILTQILKSGKAGFLKKKFFTKKLAQNKSKNVFFEVIENIVHQLFCIWSIIKVNIIFYIHVKMAYLERIWFLRCDPKCSQPLRLQDF